MIEKIKSIPLQVIYILIAVATAVSYGPAKEYMIAQDAWVRVVKSSLTLNTILFLFMWGMMADKVTKHLPKRYAWGIWGAGLIGIIMLFNIVGGIPTIFNY